MINIDMQQFFDRPHLVPLLIMAISLGVLGIALAAQYWGGLQPCILCIYQRYAYLGAFGFGLIGLAACTRPRAWQVAVAFAGLAFLAGSAVAAFQVGVEQGWWRGTPECHTPTFDPDLSVEDLRKQLLESPFVPCDVVTWSLFGISMAGYNAIFSLGLAAITFFAGLSNSARRAVS